MKKIISLLFISVFVFAVFFVYKQNVRAEVSDLQDDIVIECVTFAPTDGFGRWPNDVEAGTFTGTCSAPKCDIYTCLPGTDCILNDPNTGFVKLDSGNNFFSQGEINETGRLVGVDDHTTYYLYAGHTPEALGAGAEGQDSTQQQGQAPLIFPQGVENCTQIYWDPYGRVFDSVSLEPFGEGDATVTLLDENGNPSTNAFVNNVLTDKMGKYNIRIKSNGKYKLSVAPKTNHLFTSSEPNIKYKDLYEFIYKFGDPAFVETANNPKRVDVALKPIGAPYSRDPDYISKEYLDVWHNGSNYTKIALRTVHPKTIIKVMVDGVQLTEDGNGRPLPATSDKEGYWLALIKKEVLSQEGFSIELIKNPQYYPLSKNGSNFIGYVVNKLSTLFIKKVSAQQSIRIDDPDPTPKLLSSAKVIKFEPILEYVEGFAYDDNNKIIPMAKVNVRLKMNSKIYYSTAADATGFFSMYPQNLPPYEFYLEIINPTSNKISVQATSEFVEKNKTYLDSEKIDLLKATKWGQKIVDPVTGKLNEIVKNDQPINPANTNTNGNTTKSLFNPAILLVSIIVLLIMVALGLALYIKKRNISTFP